MQNCITNLLTSSILLLTTSSVILGIYGYCLRAILLINPERAKRLISDKVLGRLPLAVLIGFILTIFYIGWVLYFSASKSVHENFSYWFSFWISMIIGIILLAGAFTAILIVIEGFRQISKKITISRWKKIR